PAAIGSVVASFNGPRSTVGSSANPQLIIVQDLHFNYSVQKNIARLLQFLDEKGLIGKMVAVEGATGPVDNRLLAAVQNPRARAEFADFFMANGELTGSQYFAVLSGQPDRLIGVEDPVLFQANRKIFSDSFELRQQVRRQLLALLDRLDSLSGRLSTRTVRALLRAEQAWLNGKLSTDEYWNLLRTHGQNLQVAVPPGLVAYLNPSRNINHDFLEIQSVSEDLQDYAVAVMAASAGNVPERSWILARRELKLAAQALAQHCTLQEIRHVSARVDKVARLLPLLGPDLVRETTLKADDITQALRSSVDFYVAAVMRNPALFDRTVQVMKMNVNPALSTVLVVGGFHTDYLTGELRRRGISYVVLSPEISSQTQADEDLYDRRFRGIEFQPEEAARQILSKRWPSDGSLRFAGAGLVKSLPVWAGDFIQRAQISGGLRSDGMRRWARIKLGAQPPPANPATATPHQRNVTAWVPAQSASTVARWVWQQMEELDWVSPSKYFWIAVLAGLAPIVVPHEALHVLAAFPRIRTGEIRFNPWGLISGTPLLTHRGYVGAHPVEPWYVMMAGPAYNIFVSLALMVLRSIGVVHLAQLFSPSWGEAYGIANLLFLFLEIGSSLSLRRGDMFALLHGFQFDPDSRVLLSVEDGRQRLREIVREFVRRPQSDYPPHVALIRIDPEFQAIADLRIPPPLAWQLRQRIVAYLVEYLRERKVMPDSLLAATESNDEIMVLLPGGVERNIKETHLKNALKTLDDRWLRGGYEIFPLEDQLKELSNSQFERLAAELRQDGIFLACSADRMQSTALVLRPTRDTSKAGNRSPVSNVILSPRYLYQKINDAASKLGVSVDRLHGLTLDFLETHHSPSYPISLSVIVGSLSRAQELAAMELEGKSPEAHLSAAARSLATRALWDLRKERRISPAEHCELVCVALERILQGLRNSAYYQPGQIRTGEAVTIGNPSLIAVRVEDLGLGTPSSSNGDPNHGVIQADRGGNGNDGGKANANGNINGKGYSDLNIRERRIPLPTSMDLISSASPIFSRPSYDPDNGETKAELILRTWGVRLSHGGRMQRLISRTMLMT
ncbi:MAG TPA: hypothetical protein VMU17_00720, partial [Elusimicrobiota bacterium]|nr:hypothetical protein [Elusimicrobiota bacterium]